MVRDVKPIGPRMVARHEVPGTHALLPGTGTIPPAATAQHGRVGSAPGPAAPTNTAPPTPRPLMDIVVERTIEAVTHGAYLRPETESAAPPKHSTQRTQIRSALAVARNDSSGKVLIDFLIDEVLEPDNTDKMYDGFSYILRSMRDESGLAPERSELVQVAHRLGVPFVQSGFARLSLVAAVKGACSMADSWSARWHFGELLHAFGLSDAQVELLGPYEERAFREWEACVANPALPVEEFVALTKIAARNHPGPMYSKLWVMFADENPQVIRYALSAHTAMLPYPALRPRITALLQHPDYSIRILAAPCLEVGEVDALFEIIESTTDSFDQFSACNVIVKKCAHLPDADGQRKLEALLQSPFRNVQCAAALGCTGQAAKTVLFTYLTLQAHDTILHEDDFFQRLLRHTATLQMTEAIPLLLKMLLHSAKSSDWPIITETLIALGAWHEAADALLKPFHTPALLSGPASDARLKSLCVLLRHFDTLDDEYSPAADAARIRAVLRGKKLAPFAMARGFDNRGQRPRRGASLWGDPYAGNSREVYEVNADARRIDWPATFRLSEERREMGIVVERVDSARGARPTVIVIDPTALLHKSSNTNLALVAGMIAQATLQSGDPVSLVIGRGEVSVPAGAGRHQLERILTAIGNTGNVAAASAAEMLEQRAVAKFMRPGTQIFYLGDFVTMDPATLERLHHSVQAHGAEWQPISVRGAGFPVSDPTIHTGPLVTPLTQDQYEVLYGEIERTHLPRVNAALQRAHVAILNVDEESADTLLRQTMQQMARSFAEKPAVYPKEWLATEFQLPLRIENPEPADLFDRMRAAWGEAARWEEIFQEAFDARWPTPFVYAQAVLTQANKLSRCVNVHHYDFALRNLAHYGSPAYNLNLGACVAMAERDLHHTTRHAARHGAPTGAPFSADSANTSTSAAATSPQFSRAPDAQHIGENSGVMQGASPDLAWAEISPQPTGRSVYLREQFYAEMRGAQFRTHANFSRARLDEWSDDVTAAQAADAQQLHRGRLLQPASRDLSGFTAIGGSALTMLPRGEFVFATRYTDPLGTHPLLRLRVAELRRAGPQFYGAENFALLTNGTTLQKIAARHPELAAEWTAAIAAVQQMPLLRAVAYLQQVVMKTNGLSYHHYQGDALAETLYRNFMERAKNGTADLAEAVDLIVRLGGGMCQEFSLLGLALLRLAGIPAGLSVGFDVEDNALHDHHAWVEVMLPRDEDDRKGWRGLPLEFIPQQASATLIESLGVVSADDAPAITDAESTNTDNAAAATVAQEKARDAFIRTMIPGLWRAPDDRAEAAESVFADRADFVERFERAWNSDDATVRNTLHTALDALALSLDRDTQGNLLQEFLATPDAVRRFIAFNTRSNHSTTSVVDIKDILHTAPLTLDADQLAARFDEWMHSVTALLSE